MKSTTPGILNTILGTTLAMTNNNILDLLCDKSFGPEVTTQSAQREHWLFFFVWLPEELLVFILLVV